MYDPSDAIPLVEHPSEARRRLMDYARQLQQDAGTFDTGHLRRLIEAQRASYR